MNQFKKAKQKAQESGKQTESIADIKTAGITQTFVSKPIEPDSSIIIEETTL